MLANEVTMKLEDCFRRDVNVTEVGKQMMYHPSYIQNVMAGRAKPSRRFLVALERVELESVVKKYSTGKVEILSDS